MATRQSGGDGSAAVEEEVKFLSMDEMIAAEDIEYAVVDGWGGKIRLASLTADDLIEWTETNEGPAKKTAGLRLVIKSIVDAKGVRIGKPEHLEALRKKGHATCERLLKEVLQLNGMSVKQAGETKKD